MVTFLFLKDVQLAEMKNKFSEINLFYKNLNKKKKKHKKLVNKGKILIKLQKVRNK